jgi:hypothetical protein
MSDNANRLWERITSETGAEISRLGTQGAMELASALFNGHAFVPYGPGQYTPAHEQQPEHEATQEQSHEQERELGLER